MSVAEKLIELLIDQKQVWFFSDLTATHSGTGQAVWIGNIPVINTDTWPVSSSFTLRDKFKIWKALKIAKRNAVLRKLNGDLLT